MVGGTTWAISEGYIPSESTSSDPALVSHERACLLKVGERDDSRKSELAPLTTIAYAQS